MRKIITHLPEEKVSQKDEILPIDSLNLKEDECRILSIDRFMKKVDRL